MIAKLGYNYLCWRDDRAVEGAALEKQCAGNGTVGSNPTLSATHTLICKSPICKLLQ